MSWIGQTGNKLLDAYSHKYPNRTPHCKDKLCPDANRHVEHMSCCLFGIVSPLLATLGEYRSMKAIMSHGIVADRSNYASSCLLGQLQLFIICGAVALVHGGCAQQLQCPLGAPPPLEGRQDSLPLTAHRIGGVTCTRCCVGGYCKGPRNLEVMHMAALSWRRASS